MNGAYPLFACMGFLSKGELEKRLDTNWWKYLFSSTYNDTSLYLKTDGDVVEDPEITQAEVDVFTKAGGIKPTDHVLDLCCGQGRHSLELARRGYNNICGVDFSQLLINTAKERAVATGLDKSTNFQQGDASNIPLPSHTFDVVMCLGNSFGYFHSVSDDVRVLQEISRVLKPGGRLVLDLADGDYLRSNYQPRSWEWVDSTMFVCREREMAEDGQRLISREIISLTDKGVIKDQIYSERLFNFETISEMLRKVGIVESKLFKELGTDSKRNQDLGMMEQRLVIIATSSPESINATATAHASSSAPANANELILLHDSFPSTLEQTSLGKGLQATRDLVAGEIVEQFVGPVMRFAEIPEEEIPFVMWVGPDRWLIPRGNCRYINHSCDPNCGLTTKREVITRRPVKKGESLCISYNVSTEEGDWHPKWTFQCYCGVYFCQGLVDRYVDINRRPFTAPPSTPSIPK